MDFTSLSVKFLFLYNIELLLCKYQKSAAYLFQPF